MNEVNINTLLFDDYFLINNIPNDKIIVGNIDELIIKYNYTNLNLSNIICKKITYHDQINDSIKNHLLPNSLIELDCLCSKITTIPNNLPVSLINLNLSSNMIKSLDNIIFPNSLRKLCISHNNLIKLPNNLPENIEILDISNNKINSLDNVIFPNSVKEIYIRYNNLSKLPNKLPNSLKILDISFNNIKSLDNVEFPMSIETFFTSCNGIKYLPESLTKNLLNLFCCDEKLISLSGFSNKNVNISFHQVEPLDFIEYNRNIIIIKNLFFSRVNGYNKIILNQHDYNKYMDILEEKYKLNKIKSVSKNL